MAFKKYSEDLKLVATRMALVRRSLTDINNTLGHRFSSKSINRWKDLYRATERVVADPAGYEKRGRHNLLNDVHLALLNDIVTHCPAIYLDELQKKFMHLTGLSISKSTMARELKERLGLSLLVTRGVHKDQSIADRVQFVKKVAGIPPEYFVFIDESGVVGRDAIRRRSWAPTGTRTLRQLRYNEKDHWTILPAVSEQGIIAGVVHQGPVERIHVELFLKRKLLPVMNPFPGRNSVLVMDNAKIHHGGMIEKLCREAGVKLIYLPAYSPDLNPIEKAFNCMKKRLQREDVWRVQHNKSDYLLRLAGRVMTRSLMQPLIVSSGYTTSHYWDRYNSRFDN